MSEDSQDLNLFCLYSHSGEAAADSAPPLPPSVRMIMTTVERRNQPTSAGGLRGELRAITSDPAALQSNTAAVVLGFCHRVGPTSFRLSMRELPAPAARGESAVVEFTRALTQGIEAAIRSDPEQWVWMHRRWRRQPPASTTR